MTTPMLWRRCPPGRAAVLSRVNPCSYFLGLELAVVLQRLYPDQAKLAAMARLLGDDATLGAILAGKSSAEIKAAWASGIADFAARRKPFLLYPVRL